MYVCMYESTRSHPEKERAPQSKDRIRPKEAQYEGKADGCAKGQLCESSVASALTPYQLQCDRSRLLLSAVYSARKGRSQILLKVCKEFRCSFQLTYFLRW